MKAAWWGMIQKQPLVVGLAGLALLGGVYYAWRSDQAGKAPSHAATGGDEHAPSRAAAPAEGQAPTALDFPAELWPAAGLKLAPARVGPLAQTVELTGKIALNEDRIAHIFPLVDGRVDDVKIQLGDPVKQGQLLVVVQSKEVGQTMLQLYQHRLQRDFAVVKDRWTQTVATNTLALIQHLRDGASVEEIERQMASRPLGDYRDKLMSAYIAQAKAKKNLERLAPLLDSGTVTGKQMLEAESEWNAARATLQSLLEQFQQDVQQASATSQQLLKELETQVAVDETNLQILGFRGDELKAIDPVRQGETISHYPIHAPFDGVIISKDVVLLERVGPEQQILGVADLSTVWVSTDIYEEHLPLLKQLNNQPLQFRCPAWPGETFTARVFYTGDLVQESSRTISMRAVANNADGRLKPGLFVNVELPSLTRENVLQAPLSAILDHAGKSFVFVHLGDGKFVRRDVTLGARNAEATEILAGVEAGEALVERGGFTLKTRMLAELLAE